jgi:hypothetical protein
VTAGDSFVHEARALAPQAAAVEPGRGRRWMTTFALGVSTWIKMVMKATLYGCSVCVNYLCGVKSTRSSRTQCLLDASQRVLLRSSLRERGHFSGLQDFR